MNKADIGILIVDDEFSVRNSLSRWFKEDGFRVAAVEDGAEALKRMQEQSWDIALVDIKMPGMSGLELQRRIKEIDKNVLVIIITAYASVESAVQALKEGAFDYVTKPVDPDDLSHLVQNALNQRMLAAENILLRTKIEELSKTGDIVGESSQMKKVMELVRTVAQTDATVMIRGESGT